MAKNHSFILVLGILLLSVCLTHASVDEKTLDKEIENSLGDSTKDFDEADQEGNSELSEEEEVIPEKLEYAKGSVCGYCRYCSFCEECKDCPCETSASKPNCKMCKYCKFCNLCSSVCDTVCTPGGILDRFTGAIVNSLPTVDHDEVSQDIDSVRHYIKDKHDEL